MNNFKNLDIDFNVGRAGSSLLHGLFSTCSKQELVSSCGARASDCGRFSSCRAPALGHVGSVVSEYRPQGTNSVVVAPRLGCSMSCGNLLGAGIEPVSSALAGRFFTTEPPGKPFIQFYSGLIIIVNIQDLLGFILWMSKECKVGVWFGCFSCNFGFTARGVHVALMGVFSFCLGPEQNIQDL